MVDGVYPGVGDVDIHVRSGVLRIEIERERERERERESFVFKAVKAHCML